MLVEIEIDGLSWKLSEHDFSLIARAICNEKENAMTEEDYGNLELLEDTVVEMFWRLQEANRKERVKSNV